MSASDHLGPQFAFHRLVENNFPLEEELSMENSARKAAGKELVNEEPQPNLPVIKQFQDADRSAEKKNNSLTSFVGKTGKYMTSSDGNQSSRKKPRLP